MVEPFLISNLIAAVLLRQLTDLRIRIGCMQPIRPSGFSSFGSQLATASSKQWSTLLSRALPIDLTAVLMLQQGALVRKSLDMGLARVVSDNVVVVHWTLCIS